MGKCGGEHYRIVECAAGMCCCVQIERVGVKKIFVRFLWKYFFVCWLFGQWLKLGSTKQLLHTIPTVDNQEKSRLPSEKPKTCRRKALTSSPHQNEARGQFFDTKHPACERSLTHRAISVQRIT